MGDLLRLTVAPGRGPGRLPTLYAHRVLFSKPRASFEDCLTLCLLPYCIAIKQGKIRMMSMMYQAYQNHMDLTAPWRTGAASALKYLNLVPAGTSEKMFGRLAAALELVSRTALTYVRPEFAIPKVLVGNSELTVSEEVVFSTPFGSLLHFKTENAPLQPK